MELVREREHLACAVSRPGTSGLRASGTAPAKWGGAVPTAEHPYEVVRIGVPYPLADLLNWEMNEPSTAPGDLTGNETAQIGLYAHRGQDSRTSNTGPPRELLHPLELFSNALRGTQGFDRGK